MMSLNAKRSFDTMLERAVRASLQLTADDPVYLEPIAHVDQIAAEYMVIVSVSSYFFRLQLMVYFTADDASRKHLASVHAVDMAAMDAAAFEDAIRECANRCCGSLGRELAQVFPHIGMSTPNIVDRRCAQHLDLLDAAHQQHVRLAVAQGAEFHVSLRVNAFEDLDFVVPQPAQQNTGELEMF